MPKPKQPRQVQHERHLARRIKEEREDREWTLDRLAQRMTDAGCPMDRSAIYRIESGDPPRRITVDEAVTFANVFEIRIGQLLLPTAIAKSQEATKLYRRYLDLSARHRETAEALHELERQLMEMVDEGYQGEVMESLQAPAGTPGHLPADVQLAVWRMLHGRPADEVLELLDDGHSSDG